MLVVVGLVIAFVLVVVFSNRETRQCRWREYPGTDESRWVCVHCGARTVGGKGRPPDFCLRGDGSSTP